MTSYYDKTDYRYPYTAKAILDTLLFYIASVLYPDEDYETQSKKRMILTDFVNAGDEQAVQKSIDRFKNNQANIPFTGYAIDENTILQELMGNYQVSGNYYSDALGMYVKYIPISFSFPMITFYATAYDYWRANQYLQDDLALPTRIFIPMTFKKGSAVDAETVTVTFPANLDLEITKGSLAFSFSEYLRVGRLYPIQHNITISSAFIKFDKKKTNIIQTEDGTGIKLDSGDLVVYPIDKMYMNMYTITTGNIEQAILEDTVENYTTPIVLTTAPEEGEIEFDIDSPIIINFNVGMDEDSVIANLDIVPFFEKDIVWDVTSKQLIIDPVDSLEIETEYTILINNNAKSSNDQNLEDDFILTFTTGT